MAQRRHEPRTLCDLRPKRWLAKLLYLWWQPAAKRCFWIGPAQLHSTLAVAGMQQLEHLGEEQRRRPQLVTRPLRHQTKDRHQQASGDQHKSKAMVWSVHRQNRPYPPWRADQTAAH